MARDARTTSDYVFDFWTALGWTVLSCGVFGYYVWYKMIERMREHNRRRLALLEATNEIAWQKAREQGREEELRPRFERIAADLGVMRQLTAEFRDPAIWLVLFVLVGAIPLLIAFWLIDADLIKHSAAERDAEAQLSEVFALVGHHLDLEPAAPPPKPPHQYALRAVATVCTCGLYMYWWMADIMREGNEHFHRDWAWEDSLVAALHEAR
jgi:hypothetical protein